MASELGNMDHKLNMNYFLVQELNELDEKFWKEVDGTLINGHNGH